MAENTGADVTPENNVPAEVDFSNAEAAKEAYQKALEERESLAEKNKQLFARAKKAEGFELVNGEWVKPEPKEKDPEPEPKNEPSKPNDLDYGEKAYLRSALELKGADEQQLAKEFKNKYGMSVEEMESDSVFLDRLNNLREARASQEAVPKGKGRSGESGTSDVDLAIAKYRETGELPSDFETRKQVVTKVAEQEKTSGMFSGPSVIGPRPQ